MTNDFKIRRQWLGHPRMGCSEIDATMSRLEIVISGRNVTAYTTREGEQYDHLDVPAYFLAEWVAENWWPLLWEPRKSEDGGDDADFLARHSVLSAQHGFALPQVAFVPTGRNIFVTATGRDVPFADVRFKSTASANVDRKTVESELKSFVQKVASRLDEMSVTDTDLQEYWHTITNTSEEEYQFCSLVGALGTSPYCCDDDLAMTLEDAVSVLGDRVALDICLASSSENVQSSVAIAKRAASMLPSGQHVSLTSLASLSPPAENLNLPAYRRGVQAAQRVRNKLGIKDTDPRGADRFFEKLNIDPSASEMPGQNAIEVPVTGVAKRQDHDAHLILLQPKTTQRRFTAARAAYAAWAFDQSQEMRLLTHAVTRDQQASRAFAAEMTAPFAYLRSQAKGSRISQDRLFEIAASLNIEPGVARKHAENNGLQVTSVY